jgi:hypothetical protein
MTPNTPMTAERAADVLAGIRRGFGMMATVEGAALDLAVSTLRAPAGEPVAEIPHGHPTSVVHWLAPMPPPGTKLYTTPPVVSSPPSEGPKEWDGLSKHGDFIDCGINREDYPSPADPYQSRGFYSDEVAASPAEQGAREAFADCDWPNGGRFSVHDMPGEHDPCYLIMPGGATLALNHHAQNGVDQARAQFIADACNVALRGELAAEERNHGRTLTTRDRYHEIADDLANSIAAHFGWEIGEHTSANCPWQNALDMIAELPAPLAAGRVGVATELCEALVSMVEGSGCLVWREATGKRLKDTPEWVRFYNATKRARESLAGPLVAGEVFGGWHEVCEVFAKAEDLSPGVLADPAAFGWTLVYADTAKGNRA